jgi:two-component system chemotaxis response regulator CheB
MLRILIVEDSATVRGLLTAILQSDPELKVVGTAANGEEGLRQALALKPDLITMDIRMPVMDGIEATQRIMTECPTPIVVLSAVADMPDAQVTFDAIQAGALEVMQKPVGINHADFETIRERLVRTVKLMAEVKVVRRHSRRVTAPMPPPLTGLHSPSTLLVIGASTGGPAALNTVLRGLPADFPLPIAIVQHMSTGFLPSLLTWLQHGARLRLQIATDGQLLAPGDVYFAPDDRHLVLESQGRLALSAAPPVSHVRPSATVLFKSAAAVYGSHVTGLLLTGMGDDGALGLKAIRDQGGLTLAQDEASSVVYGMPKVAAEIGAVERVLRLERIAPALMSLLALQR